MNKTRFKKSLTQNAFYFKAKRSIQMTSPGNGGRTLFGVNANGNLFDINNSPIFYTLTSGTGTGTGFLPTDMPTQIGNLYDQYRMAAIKIQWHPSLPNGSIQGAYLPGVIVYDRDGIEDNIQTQTFDQLLENISGTTTFNMYRPWKRYIKFPKYKLNTRIPSIDLQSTTIQANENIAGQWLSPGLDLVDAVWGSRPRGTHICIYLPRNSGGTDSDAQAQGTLLLTTYWVFKDRK